MERANQSDKNRQRPIVPEPLEPRRLLSRIVYVDVNSPAGGNGTSWASAYDDLQDALQSAAAGDQIRVADGIYRPTTGTDRTSSFRLLSRVSLLGGYAGWGAADPDQRDIAAYQTILSGQIGTASAGDNSYHVVIASGTDASAVLDGFTVIAGYANGAGSRSHGGGIYILQGNPTIRNCVFNANYAFQGGAIYAAGSAPSFINCTFSANSAGHAGGAIFAEASSWPNFINCSFVDNQAGKGGAIYNYASAVATLTNCTFMRNVADFGSAIMNYTSAQVKAANCIFAGNAARLFGGAIYATLSSSSYLVNSSFVANQATGISGASGYGGAVCNDATSFLTAINCTFTSNTALNAGGAIYNAVSDSRSTLSNCIVWGNFASVASQIHGDAAVAFSDVQGGWAGTGNIDADPLFVRTPARGYDGQWGTIDDDYGNLWLRSISLCIDSASNEAVPPGVETDLAGHARFVDIPDVNDPGAVVDMGAYERPVFSFYSIEMAYLFNAPRPSVRISFNSEIDMATLGPSDLVLLNRTTGQYIDCGASSTVTYDPVAIAVTWVFSILLPDGDYVASISPSAIRNTLGYSLEPGCSFVFFTLGGDADHDRDVDNADFGTFFAHYGQSSGATFSDGDFDYDGDVDNADFGVFFGRFNMTLPLAAPQNQAIQSVLSIEQTQTFNKLVRRTLVRAIEAIEPTRPVRQARPNPETIRA